MAAEQGVKTSDSGVALAVRSGEAFRLLVENLTESAQAARQIPALTPQQVAGTDQIALAMCNIQQASAQNMASTKQVEHAARDLSASRRLKAMVAGAGVEAVQRAGSEGGVLRTAA
jgi:methyl-accepting chemotaxis protein